MSHVNLLDWRRKKRSQRCTRILITGIVLITLLIVCMYIGINKYQQNFRDFHTLHQLYQPLITQLSQQLEQQQRLLQQLEQAALQRQQIERVHDQMNTYHLLFQWLADRLPEYSWFTALSIGQSGWRITGQSLRLEEVEQFIQQVLSVEHITALSLNDLKREAEYYEFNMSFLSLAEVGGTGANGR